MQEVVDVFPGAQRALFRNFHIGGCSSCGFSADETLQELCDRSGITDPEQVLGVIRESHLQDQEMMIAPARLKESLGESDRDICLLDVRTGAEFEAVHIENSRHMSQPVVQDIMSTWNPEAPIVIIDHKGEQGLDAAAYFAGHGFRNVMALEGGIDRWALEIDPKLRRYTFD